MGKFVLDWSKPWQKFFEEMTAIPHGSYHEQPLSDYLAAFAQARGLAYKQYPCGNVIICAPATAGYEDHVGVVLQAHMDMVWEKTAESTHDFLTEPLKLRVEDGWLMATDTLFPPASVTVSVPFRTWSTLPVRGRIDTVCDCPAAIVAGMLSVLSHSSPLSEMLTFLSPAEITSGTDANPVPSNSMDVRSTPNLPLGPGVSPPWTGFPPPTILPPSAAAPLTVPP